MENLDFEFLDFNPNRKGGRSLGKNQFSVSLHGSARGILAFGSELKEEVERYKYLRIARQKMTGEVYLIFNNDKGVNLRERTGGLLQATSKGMAKWLLEQYFQGVEYGRLHISENLANTVEYATYRIIGPISPNK